MFSIDSISNVIGTAHVTQVGILVNSIEEMAKVYAAFLGLPVPEIRTTKPFEHSHMHYRGTPSPGRCKMAFFKVGDNFEIELLEPDHEPSFWRECLDRNGPGMHHLACSVKGADKIAAELARQGIDCVQEGDFIGGKYVYLDTSGQLGIFTELIEHYDA